MYKHSLLMLKKYNPITYRQLNISKNGTFKGNASALVQQLKFSDCHYKLVIFGSGGRRI